MFSYLKSLGKFLAVLSIFLFSAGFAGVGYTYASGGAHWGYGAESESGPEHWGDLSHKFVTCKEGVRQSPIDIIGATDTKLADIEFHYLPTKLNIVNNGHTIVVNYTKGSYIVVGKEKYKLLQFHFHTPSEHTVGGLPAVMEMHLVHKSNRGKLAVVSVLFRTGAENVNFEPVWANLPDKAGQKKSLGKKINVMDLMPENKAYYAYSGSLTTPPCTEDVKWHVLKTPLEISKGQLKAIETILGANNRPVQPLGARKLKE